MRMIRNIIIVVSALAFAEVAMGEEVSKGDEKKVGKSFVTADSTNIDFSETMIDGAMKAPEGFFLQGRQAQALRQMVRLRSKFRHELRNSKSAVKSLVK